MECRSEQCRAALAELESLGTEEWTEAHADALRQVVDTCPNCKREWDFFQQTILIISTTVQALPSPDQSRHMWQACYVQLEGRSAVTSSVTSALAAPVPAPSTKPVARAQSVLEPRQADNFPFWLSWFGGQSSLGWAALGGACAVLAGVWLFAPEPANPTTRQPMTQAMMEGPVPVEASFQSPPAAAAALLNNHTAMAMDPFTNHVGSSLISYTSAEPQTRP